MTTPPQILWYEAGEPIGYVDGIEGVPDDTRCATCGATIDRGISLADTFEGNEDGWPYFADSRSAWVCPGCVFVSKGRWKDQFRLWSVLYCEDGGLSDHHPSVYEAIEEASYDVRLEPVVEHADDRIQITNRGKLDALLDLLLDPPECRWWAAIAESGKKKITRFTPVTAGDPWEVQFEYQTIQCTSIDFAEILYHVASMRALGVSAERIRSGQLDPSYDREHAERLRFHTRKLKKWRGHPRFELALFCCTEEYTHDAGRRAGRALIRRGATRSWRPPTAGNAQEREHRRHRAERLVEARAGGAGGRGGDGDEPPADGLEDGGQAGDRGADEEDGERDQIGLF